MLTISLLYPTFVTPWLDSSQTSHQGPIEDIFDIPAHYTSFNAPAISPKLHSFEDNTLFYIFYSAPEDLSQLEAADEL
jgi:CCR4-NOT transcription complex subunit 2